MVNETGSTSSAPAQPLMAAAYTTIYAAEHGFVYDVVRPEQREAFADMLAFLEDVAGMRAGQA